jgi:NAD(P)-dependent dehydrogenase (short-subunit alcohol dehydrogenase family)
LNKKKYTNPFTATLNGILELKKHREEQVVLPPNLNLAGKRIMITGSSSGLGLATATAIANTGAVLYMAVRSGIPERGDEIKELTGNENVHMYHVDLSDFESMDRFLDNLEKDEVKLDIFISNAAMVPVRSRETPQGLEEMFMVNYLSAFYLVNQLLDKKILTPGKSRIILVSSESHRDPDVFAWEEFGQYTRYGIGEVIARYGYFKLLLTTFANELSRRWNTDQIQIPIRVLCPGPVNSNIAREAPGWMQPLLKGVFSLFFRSPKKAAAPVLYFAAEEKPFKKALDYLYLLHRKEMADLAREEAAGKTLWELSMKLIEKVKLH